MVPAAKLPDIQTARDVQVLVDTFYYKANHDDLLAPTFQAAAHVYWPRHLTSLYEFWTAELLQSGASAPQPMPAHLSLPRSASHQHRWLELFDAAVEEQFAGQRAGQAKLVARQLVAALAKGQPNYRSLPVD